MKIVIVGSGAVAINLAYGFATTTNFQVDIAARNPQKAKDIADGLDLKVYISSIEKCDTNADLYIIAVSDRAIEEVYQQLIQHVDQDSCIVHTSGTTSIEVFGSEARSVGVLYPLQTFTRNRIIDLRDVPFYLEAKDEHLKRVLVMVVEELEAKWDWLESDKRKAIHVAAVFACNFTNYMLACANQVLHEEGLNISVLQPLIEETISKALESENPIAVQTGPARRNDSRTIYMHEAYLKNTPELKELYSIISEKIMKKFE
ncbi:Rossmann-like and DUF2520 domain-containing protein [Acetobacteroides hydrogenigenes]|uniref:Putative short-subunit dehydrogenase-like oxidoreductase (DUF2520 family) n=1 Tax=Acetobacteroides hydrogenigenes TaxID=979970 RepID=A0A4R2EK89_9BACT|nr:DUF2520 domain-containing protein [Acetobacteroides hydrogenigenes]TCN68597.1 putative short-subunit dehydrogenase-like oxidoreductase (DUF2520 family) [Acetobacteroides hydrogenigenes]